MTPSTAEVARALGASPRFEWRAGMRALVARSDGSRVPVRVLAWEGDAAAGVGARPMPSGRWEQAPVYCDDIPDLDDPATAGVLLGMLPDDAPITIVRVHQHAPRQPLWQAVCGGRSTPPCPTLGVAVARALLAVWGQP